jgi:Glyoxalase/Bleomycin resistance protein/Dioxygenase superfamily
VQAATARIVPGPDGYSAGDGDATMTEHGSKVDRHAEWETLRSRYLRPLGERPASSARGLHHFAVLCSDVERTIRFYQDLLEFPLVELFENRDYRGSTHFFFDVGHGNYLAYFDFPVWTSGPTAKSWGVSTTSLSP